MLDGLLRLALARVFSLLTFLAIGVGLVFIAFLVNRFAPHRRQRLRRTVILFGLYIVADLALPAES